MCDMWPKKNKIQAVCFFLTCDHPFSDFFHDPPIYWVGWIKLKYFFYFWNDGSDLTQRQPNELLRWLPTLRTTGLPLPPLLPRSLWKSTLPVSNSLKLNATRNMTNTNTDCAAHATKDLMTALTSSATPKVSCAMRVMPTTPAVTTTEDPKTRRLEDSKTLWRWWWYDMWSKTKQNTSGVCFFSWRDTCDQ